MKHIIPTIIILIWGSAIFSQNLVPNPSFEDGDIPYLVNQLPKATGWQKFESSDLYHWGQVNGPLNTNNIPITGAAPGTPKVAPYDGNRFIGFGPCEGAQIELASPITEYHYIELSYLWTPRGNTDTEINTYFLENEAPGIGNCLTPTIDYEYNHVLTVNADGPNAIHIPGKWYQEIAEPFLLGPSDIEYKWFAVKGENLQGDPNTNQTPSLMLLSNQYVYFDDVVVEATPYCDYPCTPELDDIEVGNFPTKHFLSEPFWRVTNATYVKFNVFSLGGNKVYSLNSFDPNGLINTEEEDPINSSIKYYFYSLDWQGTDDAGNLLPTNVNYTYTLEYGNCDEAYSTFNTLILENNLNGVPPQLFVEQEESGFGLGECCLGEWYYQDIILSGIEMRKVNQTITAGENVTTGPTGGVTITGGALVGFDAGETVELKPGFFVESGAEFHAKIDQCEFSKKGVLNFENPGPIPTELLSPSKSDLLSKSPHNFEVYPNPNSGLFNLLFKTKDPGTIGLYIYNTVGKEVWSEGNINTNVLERKIDLSNFPRGLYLVKIKHGVREYTKKVLLK